MESADLSTIEKVCVGAHKLSNKHQGVPAPPLFSTAQLYYINRLRRRPLPKTRRSRKNHPGHAGLQPTDAPLNTICQLRHRVAHDVVNCYSFIQSLWCTNSLLSQSRGQVCQRSVTILLLTSGGFPNVPEGWNLRSHVVSLSYSGSALPYR